MAQINLKLMQQRTLSYLGDQNQEGAFALSEEIAQCVEELEREARFLGCYEKYDITFDEGGSVVIPELELALVSQDLAKLFAACHSVCVLASTLGVVYDRYAKRIMNQNMSHGVVLDAAASAYLECKTDLFEEELNLGAHTFRFAPGYGDLDLSFNVPLLKAIRGDKKIGITHTTSGLFVPQKSMLGLIGFGTVSPVADEGLDNAPDNATVSDPCSICARYEDCSFRSRGARCSNLKTRVPG